MAKVIGIDLGTTSSRVAIMQRRTPVIIENSEGEGTTPSYVALTAEGTRLVGEAALRYALGKPENVVFAVKRLIGRRYADPVVQELKRFMPFQIVEAPNGDAWVRVLDNEYSPDQITAFILQKMRKTAEEFFGEEIKQAVIAVPAYFNNKQRQSTHDAALIADLEVLRLEAEPTMAALAYGLARGSESQTIVVYDLGGGTFDVSVLEIGDGVYEVKSTSGDMFLGGEDFDFRIMHHLAREFDKENNIDIFLDPIARHRLKTAAEDAKISLSISERAQINLPFIATHNERALHFSMLITRSEFENLIEDLIDRTIKVCSAALKDAGLKPSEVDEIILVGGSTRIPLVLRDCTSSSKKRRMVDCDEKTPWRLAALLAQVS